MGREEPYPMRLRYHQLSQARVDTILKNKTPGFYLDGHGLHLQLHRKFGTGSWVLRYTSPTIVDPKTGKNKKRDLGLGAAPTVTLASARRMAGEFRETIVRA